MKFIRRNQKIFYWVGLTALIMGLLIAMDSDRTWPLQDTPQEMMERNLGNTIMYTGLSIIFATILLTFKRSANE